MNKFINETTKRHAEQDEWLKFFYQSTESSRNTHNKIIQDLDSRVKNLAKEVDERTSKEEPEECKVIYSADGIPLYIPFEYSPEEIEYFATHPKFSKLEEPKILKSEKKETLEAITETKQNVSHYIEPYEPPIPYPRRLEQHAEEALVNQTMESLKEIWINRPLLKEIRRTDNYAKYMKDLVADKQKFEEEEIKMNPRCSAFLKNQFPPKEQDPGSFILPCSIGKQEFSNALADLGASISLMPLSLYKRLGIRKLEPCNMVIELADNSKRTAHGIVENLLIKIDKFIFPVDFVILDMVEDPRMPIILGRPLLATAHASVDIFRKSISLEVGNEKVIFKMRSTFTSTFESIRSIKTIENAEENDILNIKDDIFLYEACEYNELLKIKPDIFSYEINIQESYDEANYRIMREMPVRTHWCEPITQFKNNKHHYWASCDPYGEVCDGGDNIASENRNYWKSTNDNERNNLIWEGMSSKDWIRVKYGKICKNTQDKIIRDYWRDEMEKEKEDNLEIQEECEENKDVAMLKAIYDKLDDNWFQDSSDDEVDLIGILDYLEPNSYNGFTNCENESYNKRKCELLGMTYTKAPPIIIEKAEITRYILGPDESYTKVKILEIDGLLRTQENVADIRAKIVSEVHNNNKT
ncbi:hypothetical protein Tco_0418181 [Tanacetum coccineum]